MSAGKWMLPERLNYSLLTRAEISSGGWSVNSDMLCLNEHPLVHTEYTHRSVSFPSLSLCHCSGPPLSSSSTCPCLNESRGALFLAPCHHPRGSLPFPALFPRHALHDGKPVAPSLSTYTQPHCPSFVHGSDMCWRWAWKQLGGTWTAEVYYKSL